MFRVRQPMWSLVDSDGGSSTSLNPKKRIRDPRMRYRRSPKKCMDRLFFYTRLRHSCTAAPGTAGAVEEHKGHKGCILRKKRLLWSSLLRCASGSQLTADRFPHYEGRLSESCMAETHQTRRCKRGTGRACVPLRISLLRRCVFLNRCLWDTARHTRYAATHSVRILPRGHSRVRSETYHSSIITSRSKRKRGTQIVAGMFWETI